MANDNKNIINLSSEHQDSTLELLNILSSYLEGKVTDVHPDAPEGAQNFYTADELSFSNIEELIKDGKEIDSDYTRFLQNLLVGYGKEEVGDIGELGLMRTKEFTKPDFHRASMMSIFGEKSQGYDLVLDFLGDNDALTYALGLGKGDEYTPSKYPEEDVSELLKRILEGKKGLTASDRSIYIDEETGLPMTEWGFSLFGIPIGGKKRKLPGGMKRYEKLKEKISKRFSKKYNKPLDELIKNYKPGLIGDADVEGIEVLTQPVFSDVSDLADMVEKYIAKDTRSELEKNMPLIQFAMQNDPEVQKLIDQGQSFEDIISSYNSISKAKKDTETKDFSGGDDLIDPKHQKTFPRIIR